MPNLLRDAIAVIRAKRAINSGALLLGIAGFTLLFYADWKVGISIIMIGYAAKLFTP